MQPVGGVDLHSLTHINSSFHRIPSSTLFINENFTDWIGLNMTTTNGDSLCQPPEYEQGLIIVVYGLVSIGAIAGNAIVCFIVASFERMRKTENFFIFNLALLI
jgi:hypothetical protein